MSREHSIYHYATRADYEPVITDVAAQLAVKYVDEESRTDPNFPVYSNPVEAPLFDVCKWPQWSGVRFLIFPADAELPWEYWPHRQSLDPTVPPKKYLFAIQNDPATAASSSIPVASTKASNGGMVYSKVGSPRTPGILTPSPYSMPSRNRSRNASNICASTESMSASRQ